MLDFTAIDFETANKYANSACSLAAVTMHDDICTDEAYTLIKPPFMEEIPGIHAGVKDTAGRAGEGAEVRGRKTFEDWKTVKPAFGCGNQPF